MRNTWLEAFKKSVPVDLSRGRDYALSLGANPRDNLDFGWAVQLAVFDNLTVDGARLSTEKIAEQYFDIEIPVNWIYPGPLRIEVKARNQIKPSYTLSEGEHENVIRNKNYNIPFLYVFYHHDGVDSCHFEGAQLRLREEDVYFRLPEESDKYDNFMWHSDEIARDGDIGLVELDKLL